MKQIFISYQRDEEEFASVLRNNLQVWGYITWMDKFNIRSGAYWPDEIDNGLNSSDIVIGILSPNALKSYTVMNEWDWAIQHNKELILLKIKDTNDLPVLLQTATYLDFVKDVDKGFAALLQTLNDLEITLNQRISQDRKHSLSKLNNPYVGPRPFDTHEEQFFFGREIEISKLISLITAHRTVLLYAQSGAGKTSLVKAKLIPTLKDRGFQVFLAARIRGVLGQDVDIHEISNIYIYNILNGWESSEKAKMLTQMTLTDYLKLQDHILDDDDLPSPRIIMFDQFEELFTSHFDRWKDRSAFFKQVDEALEADPFLRIIFVMREDYIAHVDTYAKLLPENLRTRFRLERLHANAALDAITKPLIPTSKRFENGVAEQLVDELLKNKFILDNGEITYIEGEFVEPVQLQVVCQRLWDTLPVYEMQITKMHLDTFGDIREALGAFYEDCIYKVSNNISDLQEKSLRDWFEKHLITPAGTRGIVYRDKENTAELPNIAVDMLESMHIIRAEWRAGARWYELSHDRFVEAIIDSNKRNLEEKYNQVVEKYQVDSSNRQKMLDRINRYWIDEFLKYTIPEDIKIELEINISSHATLRDHNLKISSTSVSSNILSIYRDVNKKLLILGEPGSGKTTLLITLAQQLIKLAQLDKREPIPVIFSLSSWNNRSNTFAEWIIDELDVIYGVSKKISRQWLDENQLALLLDGLDEVHPTKHESCILAINEFRKRYSFVDLVICTRPSEYMNSLVKLDLEAAISIIPLTETHIDKYLGMLGENTVILRKLLAENQSLAKLAKSPLFLNIMITTFRDLTLPSILQHAETQHYTQIILNKYIEQRISTTKSKYPASQTLNYLHWLARQMTLHGTTTFYIDELNLSYLEQNESNIYRILLAGLYSFILLLLFSTISFIAGITWGSLAICTIIVAYLFRRISPVYSMKISEQKLYPNQKIFSLARVALIAGITLTVLFTTSFTLLFNFPIGISLGLVLGVLGSLFVGSIDIINYLVLRYVLTIYGYIPFNLAEFLNHTTQQSLTSLVGGGYMFSHRYLLDYFSSK